MNLRYNNYGTFTDWNKIIHNNLPIDQLINIGTNREIPNDSGTSEIQIGGNVQSVRSHAYSRLEKQLGAGPINWLINHLPFEMHLRDGERKLTYNFCGPGTKLTKRLARGDVGINELDNACMKHDIAYHNNKDAPSRHPADLALAEAAEKVAADPNASKDERDKANFVASVMRGKLYLGSGALQSGSGYQFGGEAGNSNDNGFLKLLGAVGGLFDYIGKRNSEIKDKKQKIVDENVKVMKEKILQEQQKILEERKKAEVPTFNYF